MEILEKVFSNTVLSTILFVVGGLVALGLNLRDFYCSNEEKCKGNTMKIIVIIEITCGYLVWAFLSFLFFSLGKFNKRIEEQSTV
ncbi:hypothetical protein BCR32DRAFT_325189 [Anaeromyces robustus]|uniref:MARVEL domain-containing protein n=1 Tax=Anaeromyces robustus TaxID=1754192 RepID=A0A1Y1XJR6_9FUNG|nr:hypothetical protein BCR32DRAFT_325189 [Anaeromyces robustus]|eukprot:ORX85991.1 hypothetical protein BCR32DRAFT_325189 [Anaeromyces robustus]